MANSLYIHIPFCDYKCEYCSFHVLETHGMSDAQSIKRHYLEALKREIDEVVPTMTSLYTIYIGGGTPTSLGSDGLIELIDHLGQYHDLEEVAELTIECNPDPHEEMIALIQQVSTHYKKLPRIRRNIGIQTFDDEILRDARRQYTFNSLVGFLRELQRIKEPNMSYNLDFIAFGKLTERKNGDIQLWDATKVDFFEAIASSGTFDGFSLYTLELFPGSARYEQKKHLTTHAESGYGMKQYGDDDAVYTEFSLLKDILLGNSYQRYELSNFAIMGKQSIHNHVYRSMESYVGVGTSASGLIYENDQRKRVTNTKSLKNYLDGQWRDDTKTVILTDEDRLIEGFFLAMRTGTGVKDLSRYQSVLVNDYHQKITDLVDQGLMSFDNNTLKLTDEGMDVYNSIIILLIDRL